MGIFPVRANAVKPKVDILVMTASSTSAKRNHSAIVKMNDSNEPYAECSMGKPKEVTLFWPNFPLTSAVQDELDYRE